MVDYMNARGNCDICGTFKGWADGPLHKCDSVFTQTPKTLTDWSNFCYTRSADAGWWDNLDDSVTVLAMKIALIHSEVSEALEGLRKSNKDSHLPSRDSVEVELADTLIRIFDLAGRLKLDLHSAVKEKLAYNATRIDHRREVRASTGGKKI